MKKTIKEEKRVFAANGLKNTGFYYTKKLLQGKYKLPMKKSRINYKKSRKIFDV